MRIFYVDSGRMPTEKAHGYQIMKMCEAFAVLGHEVTLLTARRETLVGTDDPFAYYGVARIFSFKRLPTVNLVNVVPKAGTWLLRILFLLSTKIYLAFHQYDLLYFREAASGLWFQNFILELHMLPERISNRESRIWKRAKRIAVTTNYIKTQLRTIGIPEDKVVVAPDAVDLEKFNFEMSKEEARRKLGLPTDKIILGYTGSFRTMQMDKGFSLILKSLSKISNALFVAVGGSGRDIEYYQNEARANGVENQVMLLPRAGIEKLAIYQKACDALLMPFPRQKHYEYYMSPLKMFEYMASKRPIVATDLPAVREILTPSSSPPLQGGERGGVGRERGGRPANAILVEPDNPESLAQGIKLFLDNPDLAKQIAEQAFRDVQLFTWQNRAKMILQ